MLKNIASIVSKLRYYSIELSLPRCSFTVSFYYNNVRSGIAYRSRYDCRHDVAENTELEQKAELHTSLLGNKNAFLSHLVNKTEPFEAVPH